jgi:hypothetical protein
MFVIVVIKVVLLLILALYLFAMVFVSPMELGWERLVRRYEYRE